MEQFAKAFFENWNQPQLLSLVVTVIIIFIISLIVFIKAQQQKANKAPQGTILVVEGYINIFDNTFEDATEGKLKKSRMYLFTLVTFLLVGNLVVILGFEPIATSYSVTFTLGLSTFIGIYVVALIYQKWRIIKKYKNPIDFIGQFSPLISISFRIFGNIIGGSTIMYLIYYLLGYVWQGIFHTSTPFYFFAPVITPLLHLYFDVFGAFIQAYVFTILTIIYWINEVEEETPKAKKTDKKSQIKVLNPDVY
ncbi:F0F1 ATP synthase subunit A [Mycoplasmopsis pullorum]|uniref:F0F1 ATP synthase subunit A n=1 Tax=Mycoplasmopsis pullorum TaxID=48003 RepID=UPI00111A8E98|nr:F0F1 ATP synthase subunit A [Mycoplasmopsis pullorum]TNK83879.1 F0F1 ATP synthase subunit A [Mycoplasmopsis pullorum]TNK92321.1 F0F1 ATP synthase subunit A [Mycoplasmopsis pullorum]